MDISRNLKISEIEGQIDDDQMETNEIKQYTIKRSSKNVLRARRLKISV